MCGIVGAAAQRPVKAILMEGLRRLEYRGYDSAGIATVGADGELHHVRAMGKLKELDAVLKKTPINGTVGIGHTRWATHGVPSEANAHPHVCNERVAVVHNGIIENHEQLRDEQRSLGHDFSSETDSEVIVHELDDCIAAGDDLLEALRKTTAKLHGAYALGVVSASDPGRLVATRKGSPLVVGVGIEEYFIASDALALLPVTRRFIYLEEGDVVDMRPDSLVIYDVNGDPVERKEQESSAQIDSTDRGEYRHYMQKEMHEQPEVIAATLEGRIADGKVLDATLGPAAESILDGIDAIQIIACGTSYHAGLIARYWFETLAGIPCQVEVASEFRYRQPVALPNSLFVTISQSGETADTLAALAIAKELGYKSTLSICNVPESSLVRESDLVLMTRAGVEIGVASTKAFTTQLVALLLLVIVIGKRKKLSPEMESELVSQLEALPDQIRQVLELDDQIQDMAKAFIEKHHALFLGRGPEYPVAMEGALKLKEISYIHAEAYPAGELKHGPLALVDDDMPIVAVAPNNELLEKLNSNLQEVRARGGQLFVFADSQVQMKPSEGLVVLEVAATDKVVSPIVFTVPLQMLAYHVAVLRGTDVDQPRNLAKSVTVE